jgi:ribosomal protein L13E
VDIEAVVWGKKRARRGKGFSRAELREACLSPSHALKLGIPIDIRRRTKHKENIENLKKYLNLKSEKA